MHETNHHTYQHVICLIVFLVCCQRPKNQANPIRYAICWIGCSEHRLSVYLRVICVYLFLPFSVCLFHLLFVGQQNRLKLTFIYYDHGDLGISTPFATVLFQRIFFSTTAQCCFLLSFPGHCWMLWHIVLRHPLHMQLLFDFLSAVLSPTPQYYQFHIHSDEMRFYYEVSFDFFVFDMSKISFRLTYACTWRMWFYHAIPWSHASTSAKSIKICEWCWSNFTRIHFIHQIKSVHGRPQVDVGMFVLTTKNPLYERLFCELRCE